VRVEIKGGAHPGMPQSFLDSFWRNILAQHNGGVGMSEVMDHTSSIPMLITNFLEAWVMLSGNKGFPVVRMNIGLFSANL